MLSALEKDRLTYRSEDARIRANNDVRVKKKLKAWLEDGKDVELILKHLSPDLIRSVTNDDNVFDLLDVTEGLMEKRRFAPLRGKLSDPQSWKAGDRPVKPIDFGRAWYLLYHIKKLMGHYGNKDGVDNPFTQYELLKDLYNNPEFNSRLTDGEKEGIRIINEAISAYLKPSIEAMIKMKE